MRIGIVTSNAMFATIAASELAHQNRVEIVAVAITAVLPGSQSRLGSIAGIFRRSGVAYAGLKLFLAIGSRIIAFLLRRPSSLVSLVEMYKHHPEVKACVRADSPDMIDWWRKLDIDILLSMGATHKFNAELLSLPRLAAINQHPSLLPRYSGTDPYFWCLMNGDHASGLTVHLTRSKLDGGEIVIQKSFTINDCQSVLEVVARIWQHSPSAIAEAVIAIARGDQASPQDLSSRTFYRAPTSADVHALRAKGKRVWSIKGAFHCIEIIKALPRRTL